MTTATARPSKRNPKKGKHLNETEKAEAIVLWQRGDVTLSDLEKKFGRSRDTFISLFAAAGVKKGEKADDTRLEVEKAVQAAATADATLLAQRVIETKEEVFKMSSGVRKLIWLAITKAKQENRALESELGTIRTLKEAIQAIKISQELSYEVLGLNKEEKADDEETLPELVFHELTSEQIQTMVATQMDADDLGFQVAEIDDELGEGLDGESGETDVGGDDILDLIPE